MCLHLNETKTALFSENEVRNICLNHHFAADQLSSQLTEDFYKFYCIFSPLQIINFKVMIQFFIFHFFPLFKLSMMILYIFVFICVAISKHFTF